MNRFITYFRKGKPPDWNQKVLIAVLHVESGERMIESAIEQSRTAYEAGFDAVILIEMGAAPSGYAALTKAAIATREALGLGDKFPIGVNYLDLGEQSDYAVTEAAIAKIPLLQSDYGLGQEQVESARTKLDWHGIYCGGVSFKYKPKVDLKDLPQVIEDAAWMDVITTSGSATGVAIDIEKAYAFLNAPKGCATAVASGVSIDNIDDLLPCFDGFFVNSSIRKGPYSLDFEKAHELAVRIHSWRPSDK